MGIQPPQRGTAPHFRPMSIVAKKAGWIKMPLGREIDCGPGDIVLDGDPAPPQFSAHVCYGQTAGWIKMLLGTDYNNMLYLVRTMEVDLYKITLC